MDPNPKLPVARNEITGPGGRSPDRIPAYVPNLHAGSINNVESHRTGDIRTDEVPLNQVVRSAYLDPRPQIPRDNISRPFGGAADSDAERPDDRAGG